MNRILKKHSILSLVLLIALIAAMALSVVSCDNKPSFEETTQTEDTSEATVIGEGNTSFVFSVTFADGKTKHFSVKTDKSKVGEALLDVGLISGENGAYGLYVKTVDGVTYDYDKDGKYWAFYINGQYANSGVDATEIKAGEQYAFKAE